MSPQIQEKVTNYLKETNLLHRVGKKLNESERKMKYERTIGSLHIHDKGFPVG